MCANEWVSASISCAFTLVLFLLFVCSVLFGCVSFYFILLLSSRNLFSNEREKESNKMGVEVMKNLEK